MHGEYEAMRPVAMVSQNGSNEWATIDIDTGRRLESGPVDKLTVGGLCWLNRQRLIDGERCSGWVERYSECLVSLYNLANCRGQSVMVELAVERVVVGDVVGRGSAAEFVLVEQRLLAN